MININTPELNQSESNSAKDANGITATQATAAVETLLKYIGEDTARDGLLQTPNRVCRSLLELTEGYKQDPVTILSTTFEGNSDEMIVLKEIVFTSLCEHHLLPFQGHAHVAYIPTKGRIVGLSKLARIVDCFAKRLQVQERMTQQIAEAIDFALKPEGVGVVVEGAHSCMCVRGVKKPGSMMITSSLLGSFRKDPAIRSEFLALIKSRN